MHIEHYMNSNLLHNIGLLVLQLCYNNRCSLLFL